MTTAAGYYSLERFRASLIAFMAGRAISALSSLAIFLLLAKTLQVTEYGRYLTLLAIAELVMLYSSLGVPWVAIRFVPEYRIKANAQRLRSFLAALVLSNLLPLLAVLLLMGLASGAWTGLLALEFSPPVVQAFLFVCLFDGTSRICTALVLEPLLAQRSVQGVQIVRNAVFLVPLVLALGGERGFDVQLALQIEAAAAAVALAFSLALSLQVLRSIPERAEEDGWSRPSLSAFASVAWYNYSSNAVANLYSPAALQLIANAALGPAAAALFGFARGLGAQVRRYLPSELLLSVIRPMLVARYAEDGDHQALNRRMLQASKWNLIVVAPLLAILIAAGPPAIAFIGDAELQDAFWLVVVLLLLAFTHSHRSLLGLYVNCVQQTDIWLRACLNCLLVLPLTWLSILAGWGTRSLAVAMVAEEILLTVTVTRMLRDRGYPYSLALPGSARILFATVPAYLAALIAAHQPATSTLPAVAATGGLVYLATLALLAPLDDSERRLVNRLARRSIFRAAGAVAAEDTKRESPA